MSNAAIAAAARRPKKPRTEAPRAGRGGRRPVDTSSLVAYLEGLDLGVKPTVHVNGHSFAMALVTVDFGTPIKSAKIPSDHAQEFSDRLRKLACDVLGRETNIRISHDGANGVYWAGIA